MNGSARVEEERYDSLADFQRSVMDSMRSLVPASGAFICLGNGRTVARAHSSRMVEGAVKPIRLRGRFEIDLAQAFGLDAKDVVRGARRAHAIELDRGRALESVPYFRDNSADDAFVRAILVPLHEEGSLFGICGLERRKEEPDFTPSDVERAEQAAPLVLAALRVYVKSNELQKEATALRSLARRGGTLLAVDRAKRRVVWLTSSEEGVDWPARVDPWLDEVFALAVAQSSACNPRNGVVPASQLCGRTVLGISNIEEDSIFGSDPCVIVHLGGADDRAAWRDHLSAREYEVGSLLVAGYNRVNIAAIIGLSENTVRTYMRRLYMKLGVSNRVDLVREFLGFARNG